MPINTVITVLLAVMLPAPESTKHKTQSFTCRNTIPCPIFERSCLSTSHKKLDAFMCPLTQLACILCSTTKSCYDFRPKWHQPRANACPTRLYPLQQCKFVLQIHARPSQQHEPFMRHEIYMSAALWLNLVVLAECKSSVAWASPRVVRMRLTGSFMEAGCMSWQSNCWRTSQRIWCSNHCSWPSSRRSQCTSLHREVCCDLCSQAWPLDSVVDLPNLKWGVAAFRQRNPILVYSIDWSWCTLLVWSMST